MSLDLAQLTDEQQELLRACAGNGGSLALFRRSDTRGPAVRTAMRKFYNPRDPTFAQRYIDALRALVEISLLRPKTAEIYELTNQGWEFAAKSKR